MSTLIQETQRRQYEGHNTPLGYHIDQGPWGRRQYDDQGEYCDLSTASEVFFIFTNHLYLCLCNYNAKCFITLQEGSIAKEYSLPPILPSPHFRWVVNTVTDLPFLYLQKDERPSRHGDHEAMERAEGSQVRRSGPPERRDLIRSTEDEIEELEADGPAQTFRHPRRLAPFLSFILVYISFPLFYV